MNNFSVELTHAIESDCAHAMEALMQAKRKEDFDNLLELLEQDVDESNAKVRALYALGRWGDNKATTVIVKALPGFNELERVTAVDALGRMGGVDALDCVITLKEDPSPNVRKFVVRALSRFKKAKADKELKSMIANDKEEFVRNYASKLLDQTTKK